jgi:hypothetical protein
MAADASAATPLKRRGLLIGAGVAGSAAVVANVLPGAAVPPVDPPTQLVATPAAGDGYQLTAHVQRYYDTARV